MRKPSDQNDEEEEGEVREGKSRGQNLKYGASRKRLGPQGGLILFPLHPIYTDQDSHTTAMDEQDNDFVEEEGGMDVSEAAAGLVQAALNIAAPEVLLPGDVKEVPEHFSRVKLGETVTVMSHTATYVKKLCLIILSLILCTNSLSPSPPSPSYLTGNGLVSAPSPPGAAKATKAGILRFQPPNTYRIDNQQRRVSDETPQM